MLTSLSVVEAALEAALAPVDTQHAYGTQIVELLGEGEARSVSYFTATHFGRGKYVGQVVYAYGQYQVCASSCVVLCCIVLYCVVL